MKLANKINEVLGKIDVTRYDGLVQALDKMSERIDRLAKKKGDQQATYKIIKKKFDKFYGDLEENELTELGIELEDEDLL